MFEYLRALGTLAILGIVNVGIGATPPERPWMTVDSLRDIRGNVRSLGEFRKSPAVVLAFVSTECPIANLYLPRLVEAEKANRSKGVAFVAVYPHDGESVDDVAGHSYERKVEFLVTKDHGGKLARSLEIERVPTVCILDGEGNVRYRGRFDDQFGSANRRTKPTREDFLVALSEVLAGNSVSVAETAVDGCLLPRSATKSDSTEVTFTQDVARILQNRCEECHRAGRIGPFALGSYQDAVDHSAMIAEVVSQRRMPPWHADPRFGKFHNDRRMSNEEIETVTRWIELGCPKGEEKDAPPRKEWVEGWEMGKPDVVLKVPRAITVPATGVVPYKYIPVPTGFTEDKWIVSAEGKPGSAAVVHHIIIYILSPERLDPFSASEDMSVLTAWAPGDGPFLAAPGTALRVPSGSTLLFEMHYTPNGKETLDQSMVGVRFADKPPERTVRANFFGNESIAIPPHDPHHRETKDFVFNEDARILSFLPHMHWRGKHFEYIATYPDGREEVLLSVPRWDFNWQTGYWLEQPLAVRKGTRIRAICHWDNSRYNPTNPDPDKTVYWGLQTWDEMMVGWMYYVSESPDADREWPKPEKLRSASMFKILDRDKDGWVRGKEVPGRFAEVFDQIGIDREIGFDPLSFEFIFREMMPGGGSVRPGERHGDAGPEHRPSVR